MIPSFMENKINNKALRAHPIKPKTTAITANKETNITQHTSEKPLNPGFTCILSAWWQDFNPSKKKIAHAITPRKK